MSDDIILRAAELNRSQRTARPFSAVQRSRSLVPEETRDSPPTESPEAAAVILPAQEVQGGRGEGGRGEGEEGREREGREGDGKEREGKEREGREGEG